MMKIKSIIGVFMALCLMASNISAQSTVMPLDTPNPGMVVDSWTVNVRQMPDDTRAKITETMNKMGLDTAKNRGIISDLVISVGSGLVSGLVDAVVTETFNLAQYRKKQKQEWMKMIQNENYYTDSITSIKGLKDFYNAPSDRGPFDPSDINFDGIVFRGMRNGKDVIHMSCSIDKDNLDDLFNHSKFNLVLDTLEFYPFQCHLPNVAANGIRTMKDVKKQKKGDTYVERDSIIRPGDGGNGFSFDERNNLRVGIEFSLYSSWINEAAQVHRNVELGNFKFTINIPNSVCIKDSVDPVYKYYREDELNKANGFSNDSIREQYLNSHLIPVEGDCFVVPRSYMQLYNGKPIWGTGEYDIKVKFSESCQFIDDCEKAKHWREDYKRLRQMQDKSGEIQEYFKTIWNQYGNNLVKSLYKTTLTKVADNLTAPRSNGGF